MSSKKKYPSDTAGNVLTESVPTFTKNISIKEAAEDIFTKVKKYSSINYIYIVDSSKKLFGVVSVKNLFSHIEKKGDKPISEIISNQELITVHPYSHQERAAQLAVKYNIKAVPVVDKDNILLGVIESDQILSIMHKEKVEDLLKVAGVYNSEQKLDSFLNISIFTSLKHRLPWLLIGLVGGLLISKTITLFENTLQNTIIISAFIPMMVYMSNAVGQQLTALLIRDSALNTKIPYAKYFFKSLTSVTLIGFIISILLFPTVFILHNNFLMACAISLAMLIAVCSSIITGFVIPFVFIKMGKDPANASGPVGTVIQDFLSVLIYFLVITLML